MGEGFGSVKKAEEVKEAFFPLFPPDAFLPREVERKKEGTGEGGWRFTLAPLDLKGEMAAGRGMRVLRTAPSLPASLTLPLPLPPPVLAPLPVLSFLGEAGGVGMVRNASWSGEGAKEMREAVVMESALRLMGGGMEEAERGVEVVGRRGASLEVVVEVVRGWRVALTPRGGCATLW